MKMCAFWRHWKKSFEVGSRTRRRPIGRDYAAAEDAEVGKKEVEKLRRWEGELEKESASSQKNGTLPRHGCGSGNLECSSGVNRGSRLRISEGIAEILKGQSQATSTPADQ
jgi:hypothetical protein